MSDAELWADMIAGAALVVSGVAVVQSRRSTEAANRAAAAAEESAKSAERMSAIDAARHAEERRPEWQVRLDSGRRGMGYTGPPRLVIALVSPETVEHVAVVSIDDGKLTFKEGQEGVTFASDTAETVRPVLQGREFAWHVLTPTPPRGGKARVELRSTIGGLEWRNVFVVALPSSPRQSSFVIG